MLDFFDGQVGQLLGLERHVKTRHESVPRDRHEVSFGDEATFEHGLEVRCNLPDRVHVNLCSA